MWVSLFPVGKIPGNQEHLQLTLGACGKGLQHLAQMGFDGVDGDGHFLGDFHVTEAQAGVSGRILLAGGEAVPAQQVVIGGVVFAYGKGEQSVDGFRDGQVFFVGNVFDEGDEIWVYFGQGFWPNVAVLFEDIVDELWGHTNLPAMRTTVRPQLSIAF